MKTILAALDASSTAGPVLDTAVAFAAVAGAEVEAVHVRTNSGETPELLATRAGVAYRELDGPVEAALFGAIEAGRVVAAVVGARGRLTGRRPVGHTALDVVERSSKPVVVVPPEFAGASHAVRRLLVPLEGSAESSQPIAEALFPLFEAEVETIVLHVFTEDTAPRMLDRPARDLQLVADEFLARHCPGATRIALRGGPIGSCVTDVCGEEDADLIVLSWSQDASPGHAAVIREVLAHAHVPVLLLPVADAVIDLTGAEPAPRIRTPSP